MWIRWGRDFRQTTQGAESQVIASTCSKEREKPSVRGTTTKSLSLRVIREMPIVQLALFKRGPSVKKIVVTVLLVLSASMFAVEPEAKVAFVKNNQIFASSTSDQPKQLTYGAAAKSLPVWSRDGSKIAFLESADAKRGLGTLVVIDQSGQQVANVLIRPAEKAPSQGMRFVEGLEWVDKDKVAVSGSVNPSLVETLVIDLKSSAEVDDLFDDAGGPLFSPNGDHWAVETGMPHFAPEDTWRPTLTVDGHDVFPGTAAQVKFLTPTQWAGDSSAVAIVALDRKSGEINLAVWQVSGVLALKKLGTANANQQIELFWTQGAFYLNSGAQSWTLRGDVLTESAGQNPSDPLKEALREQSQLESMVVHAGGTDVDFWCKSCALAALPRRKSVAK